MIILHITVDNAAELLNASAFGAGALLRVESSATEGGTYAEIGTEPLVSGTTDYTVYDTSGTDDTWYRSRYSTAAPAVASDYGSYSLPFQDREDDLGQIKLADVKSYLDLRGTGDDELLIRLIPNAIAMAESDTGRILSVTSNTTYRYSTDGQASLVIHDRPYSDATRTVTLNGAPLIEGVNCWFLPDRRNNDVSATIQLRYYDTTQPGWYLRFSNWFDANLDNPRYWARQGAPNDLVITGTVGHPEFANDIRMGLLELIAFLYWRAKGGASSFADLLTGTNVDLKLLPQAYQAMVKSWGIRTAVAVVG